MSNMVNPTSPRYFIRLRDQNSLKMFFLRTIAAQIHIASALATFVGILILSRLTANQPLSYFLTANLFGICTLMLFCASALAHFLDDGFHLSPTLTRWLENFDKFSIYLVIASTYTVIAHRILSASSQWVLISAIWSLAFFGCVYTAFIDKLPRWAQSRIIYTGQFILMGWTILAYIKEVVVALTPYQTAYIFAGGAIYSLGAVQYAFQWPRVSRYFGYHEIWHTCVSLGSLMFFLLVCSLF